MTPDEMKRRTKRFALAIIQLVASLPRIPAASVMGHQLLRSATSVGANYRAACCARSPAEFVAKMGIVREEADESLYWLELLVEAGVLDSSLTTALMRECDELVAIFVASINTAKARTKIKGTSEP